MESLNLSLLTKKLFDTSLSVVNTRTLQDILGIQNRRSFFQIILHFQKNNLIRKIEKDKYHILNKKISDFIVANFIYEPSYISLETALNYWGILSQFPFEITSVTTKKKVTKKVDDKIFSYNHLSEGKFGMFRKIDGFLIASPEKALFDQLYFVTKGIKSVNLDEYNVSRIKKADFLKICHSLDANNKIYHYIGEIKWSL